MKGRIILIIVMLLVLVGCKPKVEENKHFNVQFETYGGQYVKTQKIMEGDLVSKPDDPLKTNHTFENWYKDDDFLVLWNFENEVVTSDLTIFAKFVLNLEVEEKHDVVFKIDGTTFLTAQVIAGEKVSQPTAPDKLDHVFLGWFIGDNLYNFNLAVTTNLEIIGKYQEIDEDDVFYTVTFKDENGNLISSNQYLENTKVTKPADLEKVNFIFDGWYLGNEKYNFNNLITSDLELVARFREKATLTITLVANGGNLSQASLSVFEGDEFSLPTPTHPEGFIFIGWFDSNNSEFLEAVIFDNITLYAKYFDENNPNISYDSGTYPEAIWFEVYGTYQNVSVLYKESSATTYNTLDDELIRNSNNTTLIDIVGLKAGYYDVKITLNGETNFSEIQMFVEEHDRSGYAHFNYTAGVGAYLDDGTLKPNAVVVYVTDQNKDTITIPGISQVGLGYILNNNQFSGTSFQNSIAYFNQPIVFRLIGKINPPAGVTAYNSTENGGSTGDNGFMVRMKDAKDITIEGIGQGAEIHGWGIHFMASRAGRGIGFEVRNLTFDKYPEDAIGLEGVQSGSTLTAPVSRGWIHNNTIKQGDGGPNPAENDKVFGDGSLDIKRGEYFTISYNHFLGAYKTSLVGATTSDLQFHFTYHHNLYVNAQSRTPLTRVANVHMYNNVFMTTDDNQGEVSYAMNTRLNAYIFSEANYFHGIKNPFRVDSGAVKSFGDVLYSTYDSHGQTTVENRETAVASGNKYQNFDTNVSIFYYDSVNKRSDVKHLTDAVTAKMEVMTFSGTYKQSKEYNETDFYVTNVQPTLVGESSTYSGGKIQKGQPFFVFEIQTKAQFEMVSGSGSYKARLVDIFGREMLTGTGSVNLEPGIYVLESQQSHGSSKGSSQAKEANVSSFSIELDSAEASEARVSNYLAAVANLPQNVAYTQNHYQLINAAVFAYGNLTPAEQAENSYIQVQTALTTFQNLGKTHIEGLINAIGLVDETSFAKISAARSAYDSAILSIKTLVTNYQTLVNAEADYQQFAVNNLIADINALNISGLNISDRNLVFENYEEHLTLLSAYESLDVEDKALVTNIDILEANLVTLKAIVVIYELSDELANIDNASNHMEAIPRLYDLYNNSSNENKAILSTAEVTKLNSLYADYLVIKETRVEQFYHFLGSNSYFTVGNGSGFDIKPGYEYDGLVIDRGLKVESKTTFEFTASSNFRLEIVFDQTSKGDILINGQKYQIVDFKVVLDLAAGTYTITRDSDQPRITYLLVTENF